MLYIITAIVSGSMGFVLSSLFGNKSEYERRMEDAEQIEYLKQLREQSSKKNICNIDKNEWGN